MTDFDYKKYSLENLENWLHDALSCGEASPHEIYSVIRKVVQDEYNYHKEHSQKCLGVLELLSGHRPIDLDDVLKERAYYEGSMTKEELSKYKVPLTCDKDDPSPECKGAWNNFWEDSMPPWGHSDLEYLANPTLTEDRISNFPGEQYTEEELNAMCDKAASDQEKEKCREYNLREAEYYNKRAQLDADYEAIKKRGGYELTQPFYQDKS